MRSLRQSGGRQVAGELEELADKLEAEWYANARPKSRPRKRQRDAIEKLMEAEEEERG